MTARNSFESRIRESEQDSALTLLLLQSEIESRPFPHFSFGPDAAAMPLDDSPHSGEADAVPLKPFRVIQALERAEQPVSLLHIKTNAVVTYIKNSAAFT